MQGKPNKAQTLNFKPISFEEYKNIEFMLLKSVEGLKLEKEVYRDSSGIATIGIGINLGGKKLKGLWIRLVLYYLFGLTKDPKEIHSAFNSLQTLKNVIKDTQSYKYKEYKNLIDKIAERIFTTLQTDIRTSALNSIIKEEIDSYLKTTQALSLEQRQQRLNESDLKRDSSDSKNPKYLEFRLSQEQAEELFSIMIIDYEWTTLRLLNQKDIHIFNQFKEQDSNNKQCYQEFIPFVSATYQSRNPILQNHLLQKALNVHQSRFLLWAIMRYTLGNDIRRRILQSLIFNFNGKSENEVESNEEKWQTCISIFKVLNLFKESVNAKEQKQTYFDYFKKQEEIMSKAIQSEQNALNIKNSKKYLNNSNYEIYHSNYINPNELQPLQNILNPYAQFLDSLIPNAEFESDSNFQCYKLTNIDLKNDHQSKDYQEQETNQESRFKLENIYMIDKSNYNEALRAIKDYPNASHTKENLLVIILDEVDIKSTIQKPNNAYLYLVSIKGNSLDCSFVNNPLQECIKENDKAQLYLYEEQERNQPKITSLATKELILKQEENEELSAKENHFAYGFDLLNHLKIKKEEEILLTLRNYHFLLKETNNHTNLNDTTQNNPNPNNSLNTTKDNSNINQNSNNKAYTLNTTLQPNKSYSTLGIQLIVPKEQETFSNNGNFRIHLNAIPLSYIQTQTNHTITKDTPIFCYVQENKQNFITKLQENELTFNINIERKTTKDTQGKLELIQPKLIFLSFIPFKDNAQANHTNSQKIQLTSEDLKRGEITKDFKIPYAKLQDCEVFGGWRREIPILSNSQERKQSIIYNTPAIFNIEGYEQNTSNDVPWYQRHTQEEVTENSKTIDSIIDKNIYTNTINHNRLIRAIIYIETTHGYYDKIYDIPVIQDIVVKYYGNQKSFTPMNVNYDYWKELADKMGYTKEQVKIDKETNITIGYELIKRIIDRIENPTIEKIGTLYNSLAKEKISSYGRILKYYYDNKSWLNLKPPSMQDLLNHIKDNPPSIKGF